MRFKTGDKVEVLSQKELPSGSWRCAEIICGNRHNYTVRYGGYASTEDKTVVERVSRKSVRPCPPVLEVSEFWVPGDVVEVFDNLSWKMATISKVISKVMGRKYFLVRLLGSSLEFKLSKFDLRVRQSWQDDRWVVIGEGSGCWEDGRHGKSLTLYCQTSIFQVKKTNTMMNLNVNDDCLSGKNKVNIQEYPHASSKTLKRESPYCHYPFEGYNGASEKFRAIDKGAGLHRVIAGNPSSLLEQVDVAFPKEMVINGRTTMISEEEAERRKSAGAVGCSLAVNLESNDAHAHSVTCSVGSCSSGSNNSYKLPHHVSAGHFEDSDGNFSDAESFCHLGYKGGNYLLPTKEELAAEIHRLELHAYCCTMEALHASGPLTWEQEAMLTNLRLSLHISNDEHLMEIRNLVSADYSIPLR